MKLENQLNKLLSFVIGFLAVLALVGVDYGSVDYSRIADPFREGRARYLIFAFAISSGWALRKCNPWWALFLTYSFCLWGVLNYPSHGMLDIVLIAGCLFVGDALRRLFKLGDVLRWVACLALLEGLYGLYQLFGVDPLTHFNAGEPMIGRATGTFGHFTILGPFCAVGAMIFHYFKKPWPAVFCAICVISTGSTMSLLGLLGGAFYYFWRWNYRIAGWAAGAFVFVLGLSAYVFRQRDFFSFSGRIPVWREAALCWLKEPIFGNGPGSWAGLEVVWKVREKTGLRWDQVHNDFLQALIEQGLIGFAFICLGLWFFFRKAERMAPVFGAVAMVLCVDSFGNFPMHTPAYGLIAGYLASYVHNKN